MKARAACDSDLVGVGVALISAPQKPESESESLISAPQKPESESESLISAPQKPESESESNSDSGRDWSRLRLFF
jgi:hypothetical protein